LDEALEFLNIQPDGFYVDCTTGLGGHSKAIAARLKGSGRLIAIDRDEDSLAQARSRLEPFAGRVHFFRENFKNLPLILAHLGIRKIDGCLIDLGVSRYQLTSQNRGFSFREDGPLDMRMDRSQATTAEELVNQLSETELADLFHRFGEEPQARRIAAKIVEYRQARRIRTTAELAQLVADIKGRLRGRRTHPATQVFQALRIEVNQELEHLGRFLEQVISLLKIGGRLVVISFHSLEDRIVKQTFRLSAGVCICFRPVDRCTCPRIKKVAILTKKPVTPSPQESAANPSARSSKLRSVERLEYIPFTRK